VPTRVSWSGAATTGGEVRACPSSFVSSRFSPRERRRADTREFRSYGRARTVVRPLHAPTLCINSIGDASIRYRFAEERKAFDLVRGQRLWSLEAAHILHV